MSKIVTVFGSGQIKADTSDYQRAYQLGKLLGENGFAVCNGGYGGVMEASAKGAKEAGAHTIGITSLEAKGWANPWIQEERKAATWRDRLFGLIDAGSAYVLFDGATGTLTELFVIWEMTNKKLIQKPVLIMGEQVTAWANSLRGNPAIVFNDFLKFTPEPEAALNELLVHQRL